MGSQAPSRNFMSEEEKNKASIDPKTTKNASARRGELCQHKIMTKDVRQVVTNITVITAKPAQERKEDQSMTSKHTDGCRI